MGKTPARWRRGGVLLFRLVAPYGFWSPKKLCGLDAAQINFRSIGWPRPNDGSSREVSWLPRKKRPFPIASGQVGPGEQAPLVSLGGIPREKQCRKRERTVTDEIRIRQRVQEMVGAVPCGWAEE